MRGPKRTPTQREADLEKAAKMDRRGFTQQQIADELGVHRTQIEYDLKALRKRYAATQLSETGEAVSEKVEQLREVRAEAWLAWERSKQDKEKRVNEKVTEPAEPSQSGAAGDASPKTVREEIQRVKDVITTEGRLPANEYLRTIIDSLAEECKLRGLVKEHLEITGKGGKPIEFVEIVRGGDGDVVADVDEA
jgi:hypothetical protein